MSVYFVCFYAEGSVSAVRAAVWDLIIGLEYNKKKHVYYLEDGVSAALPWDTFYCALPILGHWYKKKHWPLLR